MVVEVSSGGDRHTNVATSAIADKIVINGKTYDCSCEDGNCTEKKDPGVPQGEQGWTTCSKCYAGEEVQGDCDL